MNKVLVFCAGGGLGIAAAYILDPALGGQRRLRLKAGMRSGRLGRRLGGAALEQSTREALARTGRLLAEIRSLVRQAEQPSNAPGEARGPGSQAADAPGPARAGPAPRRGAPGRAEPPPGWRVSGRRDIPGGMDREEPLLPAGYPVNLALGLAGALLLGSLAAWLAGRFRA